MDIKKGLLLLMATTLVGSTCLADPLYDTGTFVVPAKNISKTSNFAEITKLQNKFNEQPNDINLSLKIMDLYFLDNNNEEAVSQALHTIYMLKKQAPERLKDFEEAVSRKIGESQNPEEYSYILAKVFEAQDNNDAAILQYKKNIKLYPKDTFSEFSLGKFYQDNEDFSSAIQIYKSVLNKNPYRLIRSNIAECYMAMGKYDKAEAEFKNSLAKKPQDIKSVAGLYMCLKDKKALPDILVEIYPEYKTKPITPDSYVKLANILRMNKKENEAIKIFEEVVASNSQSFDAYASVGNYHKEKGNIETVKNLLKTAAVAYKDLPSEKIDTDPMPHLASILKGMSDDPTKLVEEFVASNNYKEAIVLSDSITEESPKLLLSKAKAYYQLNDKHHSTENYEKYLSIVPEDSEIRYTLAEIYKQDGDFENVKKVLSTASNDDQRFTDMHTQVVAEQNEQFLKEAIAAIDGNNYEYAEEKINKIFENGYPTVEAFITSGHLKLKLGKNEEAIQDYLSAYEMNPEDASILGSVAAAYEGIDTNLAIKYYSECISKTKNQNDESVKIAKSKIQELSKIVPVSNIKK